MIDVDEVTAAVCRWNSEVEQVSTTTTTTTTTTTRGGYTSQRRHTLSTTGPQHQPATAAASAGIHLYSTHGRVVKCEWKCCSLVLSHHNVTASILQMHKIEPVLLSSCNNYKHFLGRGLGTLSRNNVSRLTVVSVKQHMKLYSFNQ